MEIRKMYKITREYIGFGRERLRNASVNSSGNSIN